MRDYKFALKISYSDKVDKITELGYNILNLLKQEEP